MLILLIGAAALSAPEGLSTLPSPTNFGVRLVGRPATSNVQMPAALSPRSTIHLPRAVAVAAQWGRVTSTLRSAAHNRAVGGVRNSWHLSGRAIDVVRRDGVSHADIARAFRAAGYHLIESLDEGDHSHFAFGTGATVGSSRSTRAPVTIAEVTQWGVISIRERRGPGRRAR